MTITEEQLAELEQLAAHRWLETAGIRPPKFWTPYDGSACQELAAAARAVTALIAEVRRLQQQLAEIPTAHWCKELARAEAAEARAAKAEADAAALKFALEIIASDDHPCIGALQTTAGNAVDAHPAGSALLARLVAAELVCKAADRFDDCICEFGADAPAACGSYADAVQDAIIVWRRAAEAKREEP